MTNTDQATLALLSLLLQYPDNDLNRHLSAVEEVAAKLDHQRQGNWVAAFLGYLRSEPQIRLQENYTAAFDLNPSTTLNVTYHRWKDGEKRAAALARLQKVYADAGFERISGELPDYLPLMLEFLSVRPNADGVELIWSCLKTIGAYVDRLQETAPAYADLLEPLVLLAEMHIRQSR
jgi:nitrate reductase delta subunit